MIYLTDGREIPHLPDTYSSNPQSNPANSLNAFLVIPFLRLFAPGLASHGQT